MNMRRGLFRLWMVGSCAFAVFVVFVVFNSYDRIRSEFTKSRPPDLSIDLKPMYPIECGAARGILGTDYSNSRGRCWVEMPALRRLFAEYSDLNPDPAHVVWPTRS